MLFNKKKHDSTPLGDSKSTQNGNDTYVNLKAEIEIYATVKKEIQPMENDMVNYAAYLSGKKRLADRIDALQQLISTFYSIKSKCISLGPAYQKYFSDMWEHMHNSQCSDFSYVDRFEHELAELLENKKELNAMEALYISQSENLETKVKQALSDNCPILQTDLYKLFDPIVQNDISSILYFMARDGIIKRTKQGRTYLIEFKG